MHDFRDTTRGHCSVRAVPCSRLTLGTFPPMSHDDYPTQIQHSLVKIVDETITWNVSHHTLTCIDIVDVSPNVTTLDWVDSITERRNGRYLDEIAIVLGIVRPTFQHSWYVSYPLLWVSSS